MASSSFFIAFHPFSLRDVNTAHSTSATTFSFFRLTVPAGDAASCTSLDILLHFDLVCTEVLLLLTDIDRIKPCLRNIHPIEERRPVDIRRSDSRLALRSQYDAPILIQLIHIKLRMSRLPYFKSFGNGIRKCCKYKTSTASLQTEFLQPCLFLSKSIKRVVRNKPAVFLQSQVANKNYRFVNLWRWVFL